MINLLNSSGKAALKQFDWHCSKIKNKQIFSIVQKMLCRKLNTHGHLIGEKS